MHVRNSYLEQDQDPGPDIPQTVEQQINSMSDLDLYNFVTQKFILSPQLIKQMRDSLPTHEIGNNPVEFIGSRKMRDHIIKMLIVSKAKPNLPMETVHAAIVMNKVTELRGSLEETLDDETLMKA